METGYARTVVDCRDVEEWKTVTDRIAYIALPVLPADDACCVVLSSFCRDTAQRHGVSTCPEVVLQLVLSERQLTNPDLLPQKFANHLRGALVNDQLRTNGCKFCDREDGKC